MWGDVFKLGLEVAKAAQAPSASACARAKSRAHGKQGKKECTPCNAQAYVEKLKKDLGK